MAEVFAGRHQRRAQQERGQHASGGGSLSGAAGVADITLRLALTTRSTMLKTSGAREVSRIQQRWGEDAAGSSGDLPAPGRPAKHAKVCSTKRVLLELFVFVVLLLWAILIALNLASRMEPCQLTRSTVRGDLGNRFIHLK